MSVTATDWITAVFLLMALLLVRRFKTQIETDSAESYNGIAGGLTILALTALARLYGSLGMFETVPFLSETMFFDLVYWIGVITGATFVIGGVSEWLPLARNHRRYNQARIEHLELLRRVQQLVGVESRLEVVLATTLQYMADQMSFAAGAVFKYSPSRPALILEATTRDFPIDPERLNEVKPLTSGDWPDELMSAGATDRLLYGLPSEMQPPTVTVPILVGNKAVGFFLLWTDLETDIDPDDRLTLRLAAEIIARKIDTDRLVLQRRADDRLRGWRARLQDAVTRAGDTRQRLAALVRILSERVTFDYASIMIVEEARGRVKRFTSGADGRVLAEAGLPLPSEKAPSAPAVYSRQTAVYHDLDNIGQPGRSEMVIGGPVRSLLATPLAVGNQANVVLLLASQSSNFFSPRIQSELQSLNSIVALVALPEILSGTAERENDRLARLQQLASIVTRAESSGPVLETAAGLISDELDADVTRISVLDETGSFLESKALISTVPITDTVPANGQMILSLMTRHRQAVEAGQSLYVDGNANATAMVDIERRQAFVDEVRSAFLMPVSVHGGKTVVVSTASLGASMPRALDGETRSFVRAVADQLAVALNREVTRPSVGGERRSVLPTVSENNRPERRTRIGDWTARRVDSRVLEDSLV